MKNKLILESSIFLILLLIIPLVYALDSSRKEIGADIINELGITGKYNSICLIDEGVDYTHTYLGSCNLAQITTGTCPSFIAATDLAEGDSDPFPEGDQQHGTKLAGIILSSHSKYKGVAPDSKIAIVRIWDYNFTSDESKTNTSLILDAIQWCIDNKNNYNISVISLSMGIGYTQPPEITNQFQTKINNAINEGILFVKSSGNRENGDDYNMTFPAELNNVTSAGSTTKEKVSYFTRRSPNLDILAPGDKIRTTQVGGGFTSFFGNIVCWHNTDVYADVWVIRKLLPFCNYGTSFSAPFVAAAATLLKEFDSALKPHDIEKILKETGDSIYDSVTDTTFKKINLLKALNVLDWPTFHHDNRRTGFTLLKGDTSSASDVKKYNIVLHGESTQDVISRISAADVDDDENMDVIVGASKSSTDGWLYRVESSNLLWLPQVKKRWAVEIGQPILAPPSLGDTYGDEDKEIFFGLENGTLMAFDEDGEFKWTYTVPLKSGIIGELGFTAVSDIDNDGKAEIIFTDSEYDYSWTGTLYVLEDDGNSYTIEDTADQSHGGAWGAVSIANVDSDDYLEIIVPSFHGIYVYDFDGSSLSEKWSNSDGRIDGAAAVYDIDKDNEYEIIYTTHDDNCYGGATCYKRLYIRDAETGNNEGGSPISLIYISKVTPAIGDIDDDGNAEILITEQNSVSSQYGKIDCYEYNGNRCSGNWPWDGSGSFKVPDISPDIADIDGDGKYEVIIPEKNTSNMYILTGTGTEQFHFTFEGELGAAPAIGDIRGKGIADIAVKRAGSPYSILTVMTDLNNPPELNQVSNITAIAGELININKSGEVWATDEDNDNLTFVYSSPLNESGLWQTTINDTGNYSILVEASDGNLSGYRYIDLIVFNSTVSVTKTFSDNAADKSLSFIGGENKTIYVRLPKYATIVYSKINLEGKAP